MDRHSSHFSQIFLNLFPWAYLIIFVPISLGILLYNPIYLFLFPQEEGNLFSIYMAVLTLAASTIYILHRFSHRFQKHAGNGCYRTFITIYFLSVFLITFSICLARTGGGEPQFDSEWLWHGAHSYLATGKTNIDRYIGSCFNNLPNLMQLIAEAVIPWKLTHSKEAVELTWLFCDAFFITVGLFFLALLIQKLFGRKLTVLALLLMAPAIYLCYWEGFWYSWGYNMTPAFMLMNIAAYYVMLAFKTETLHIKMTLYGIASIAMMLASFLRITSFIVVFSTALLILLYEHQKLWAKWAMIMMFLLPCVVFPKIVYNAVDALQMFEVKVKRLPHRNKLKTVYHFFLIGADQGNLSTQGWKPGPRGFWNPAGGLGTTAKNKRNARKEIIELFQQRGWFHFARYYYLKLVDLYTNSAFIGFPGWATRTTEQHEAIKTAYAQPHFDSYKKYHSGWLHFLRRYIIGGVYPLAQIINYFCWTVTMIGIFLTLIFFKNLKTDPMCVVMWITMSLVTVYLMFFESYMRFLVPFSGFIIVSALFGIKKFYQYLDLRICKKGVLPFGNTP